MFEKTAWRLYVQHDEMLRVLGSLLAVCAEFRGSHVPHAEIVRAWLPGLLDTPVKAALLEAQSIPPSMTEAVATTMIQLWVLANDNRPF